MIERAPVTYRDAGVDIDAGDELVERIKPRVKRSMRPEVLGGIGGFGALVEVPLDRYRSRCWYRAPMASAPNCAWPSTHSGTTAWALTWSPCASTTSSCKAPNRYSSWITTPAASWMSASANA